MLACLVEPAAARCRRIRITGEIDDLEFRQLRPDVLDELAVAKLETRSQGSWRRYARRTHSRSRSGFAVPSRRA
jgi:hypothetical protein